MTGNTELPCGAVNIWAILASWASLKTFPSDQPARPDGTLRHNAAFLFAFFTYAKTTDTEFLVKLRETHTFKRFMDYLVVAMLSAAFLAIITVPMMIANPKPEWHWDSTHWGQIFWSFILGYAASATWRSTRQFVALAREDGRANTPRK